MAFYEMRTYTLSTAEAAATYSAVWKSHVASLKKFGIVVCGVWTPKDADCEVIALVTYEPGVSGAEAGPKFMQSAEFREDMAGFDMSTIVKVVPRLLSPIEASPMQ